ncbi:MAG: hypothetical protein ACXAEU_19855 [Candidatus Hodarchaeales archaeon]|jgi:hypothetical protein
MTEENISGKTTADQEAINQIRKALAEGFSAVQGAEINDRLGAISMEEMLARSITAIEEDQSDIRPGKINQVARIKQQVIDVVEQAKAMPPQVFSLASSEDAAITHPDGDGPEEDDPLSLEEGEDEE